MKEIEIRHVDVFTDEIFSGNPLTVIPEAEGLSDSQMQRIASEFGTPETSFILASQRHDYRLRIFSPIKEIPFAGHPIIGAAHIFVSEISKSPRAKLSHETSSGVLSIDVMGDHPPHKLIMDQGTPKILGKLDAEHFKRLCDAFALDRNGISSDVPPQIISTGLPQLFIQVNGLGDLSHLSPDFNKIREIENELGLTGVGVFTLETVNSDASAHLRFFVPSIGINEDAAAGSAAGGLGAYMAINGLATKERLRDCYFEQGFEMGRPSRLYIEVQLKDDAPQNVRVGGYSVTVSKGVINLQ
jgi:trans-2,3-dihydro-3-hydroxyanthranilate isomerase